MIIAELKGKLPSKFNRREDILTSNVFSFFKYSDRQLFREYLLKLGIEITLNESRNAEFIFWPTYEDRTEPDLVVICGRYYLLFEAKLYSDFSLKTSTNDPQIYREIKMGKMLAKNLNKKFVYVVITAEYYKNNIKYNQYKMKDSSFIWTNWQFITNFLEDKLENGEIKQNEEFARDLFLLLIKKGLRRFKGIVNLKNTPIIKLNDNIFYATDTSMFKYNISKLLKSLKVKVVDKYQRSYKRLFFSSLNCFEIVIIKKIFYNGRE